MARMIFFLLSIPAALCGSLVTATLSAKNGVAATNLSSLTDEFPNCVNNSQYAQWGEGVLPSSCGNALLSVRGIIAGSRRLFLDFNFFSMENPPRRMPNNAWPLPQGAASNDCVFTIRMAKDFKRNSLPTRSGDYYPPRQGPVTMLNTWNHIFRVADLLYRRCILEPDENGAGWSLVSDGIVVAFWHKNSTINEMYGPTVRPEIEGSNATNILSD